MVRKLIKYDFQSFFRLLFPVQMILLGIAAINRVIQLFEFTDSTAYRISFGSSLALYFISIAVLLVMTVIIAIVRFYQGLYSAEGYLSHTLPVTPTQHIFAKMLLSWGFYVGSLLSVFVSFIIITIGDVNIEIFKAAAYLIREYFTHLGFEGAVYGFEVLILFIIMPMAGLMKLYFCISVGQLVSRKKILLAFGVYFGLYIIRQIIGTIMIIIVAIHPQWMIDLAEWLGHHPHAALHIALCASLFIEAVLGTVYFIFTRLIMSKKLNLS